MSGRRSSKRVIRDDSLFLDRNMRLKTDNRDTEVSFSKTLSSLENLELTLLKTEQDNLGEHLANNVNKVENSLNEPNSGTEAASEDKNMTDKSKVCPLDEENV